MYTKRAELTAGLVVLAGVGAFLWLLFVATGRGFFERFSRWHVRFAQGDAAPEEGDAVLYLGLTIGRVARVSQAIEERSGSRLTPADRARLASLPPGSPQAVREVYVRVELELPEAQRLPRGTTARLSKNLVTGSPAFVLVPGFSPLDLTADETQQEPILGTQGSTIDDLTAKLDGLIEQATAATRGVGGVVEEARAFLGDLRAKVAAVDAAAINADVLAATGSLRNALAVAERDVEVIAGNLKTATGDLARLAAEGAGAVEQARADLAATMASLRRAAARVDEAVEAAAPKVEGLLDDLSGLARRLGTLAADLEGVGPEARGVIRGVGQDLDAILETLKDAARNILDATEDIRAHPWKLANTPDADVVAFENLRVASLTYVRAMTTMESTAQALRDLLAAPDAGSPQARAAVEAALAAFQKSREGYEAAARRFTELLRAYGPKGPR